MLVRLSRHQVGKHVAKEICRTALPKNIKPEMSGVFIINAEAQSPVIDHTTRLIKEHPQAGTPVARSIAQNHLTAKIIDEGRSYLSKRHQDSSPLYTRLGISPSLDPLNQFVQRHAEPTNHAMMPFTNTLHSYRHFDGHSCGRHSFVPNDESQTQ